MHERGIVFLNINLARPLRASSTVSRPQNYARAIQRRGRADRLGLVTRLEIRDDVSLPSAPSPSPFPIPFLI